MSLRSVLSTIGKDLKDVAGWVEDGLKIAQVPVEAIDPATAPIFTAVENLLAKMVPAQATPANVQAVATALASVPAAALPALAKALETLLTPAATT